MADGWEGHGSGHQQSAGLRQLSQKARASAGRFLGIVFEAVVPVGVFEPDCEYEVAGESQPVAAGLQADDAVPGSVTAGTMDDHARRHFLLILEQPKLAAVLFREP